MGDPSTWHEFRVIFPPQYVHSEYLGRGMMHSANHDALVHREDRIEEEGSVHSGEAKVVSLWVGQDELEFFLRETWVEPVEQTVRFSSWSAVP